MNKDYTPASDVLQPGTWMGNYRIDGVLGVGGFGVTYRGWADDLQEVVAIKEYYPVGIAVRKSGENTISARTALDENYFDWGRQRFIDEARLLASLRQANSRNRSIVRVRQLFEENGTAYMVQDFVDGDSIGQYLKEYGVIPEGLLKKWLDEILDGLAIVHGENMIHRDLTPSNILIDGYRKGKLEEPASPVLIDFGSARNMLESMTQIHDRVYKRSYAPIEQSSTDAKRQGAWTDIYSLSVVLYESVTGTLPPEAHDRIEEESYVPVAYRAKGDYSPAFLAAIDHGLAVSRHERPQSVDEWRPELFDGKSTQSVPPDKMDEILVLETPLAKDKLPEGDTLRQKKEMKDRKKKGTGWKLPMAALAFLLTVGAFTAFYEWSPSPVEEPGVYVERSVKDGVLATSSVLRVVTGNHEELGIRPWNLEWIEGTCFARSVSAGEMLEWEHLSVHNC